MAMGFIAASEMVEHDFDGKFSADVPDGSNFELEEEDSIWMYSDKDNSLIILYYENDDLNEDNAYAFYDGFCQDDEWKVEKTDKNLTFLEGKGDFTGYSGVGVHTDGKLVIAICQDADEAKDIAESVKWS